MQESPVWFLGQEILICCRRVKLPSPIILGLFVAQEVKNLPACRDLGSNPGIGRSPGEGKGCPLQYSCMQNSMNTKSMGRKESDTIEGLVPSLSRDIAGIQIRLKSPSAIRRFFPEASQNPHTCICRVSTYPLDRKPAWFHELTDKQEGSPANDFPPVSGGASRPQQEPALPKPGLSSALFLNPVPLP